MTDRPAVTDPPAVDPSAGVAFLQALRAALPDLRLSVEPADLEEHRRDGTACLEPPLRPRRRPSDP